MAYSWLLPVEITHAFVFAFVGISIAIVVYWFGFSKLARKNIVRIQAKNGKTCIFSFQTWKSYLNIAFMVTLGITLRHSAIPKEYLSVVYTSVGGGLVLSSLAYYKTLWHMIL